MRIAYDPLSSTCANPGTLTIVSAQSSTTIRLSLVLFIGNFTTNSTTIKIGGYVGVITALCAWYASAAGVSNGMAGRLRFPVGKPLLP